MGIRNKECNRCGLCNQTENVCQMPLLPVGDDILMVVGDYPSKRDADDDTVMRSGRETIFWNLALSAIIGSRRSQFYPTYAVKCKPANETAPKKAEIQACRTYLMKEVLALRPKAVLLLGAMAMQAFNIKGGVTSLRGSYVEKKIKTGETDEEGNPEYHSFRCYITFAPGYVQKQNSTSADTAFIKDINEAYEWATGTKREAKLSRIVMADTVDKIKELVGYIKQTGECSFDFETTGLNTYEDNFKATILSLSFQHGSSYVIPLDHFESPFRGEKKTKQIIKYISKEIFANPEIRKIAHNITFDIQVATKYDCAEFRGRIDDTMLMHHMYDETQRHGLKDIISQYFPDFEDYEKTLPHKSKNEVDWENVPMDKLAPYGGTDTDLTFRLCTIMENELLQDERRYILYRNLTMFALRPFLEASRTGMPIGREVLNKNIVRARFLLEQQEEKILNNPAVKKFEAVKLKQITKAALEQLEASKEGKKGKNLTNVEAKIEAIKAGTKTVYHGLSITSPIQMGEFFYSSYGMHYTRPYDKKKRGPGSSTDSKYIKKLNDHSGIIKQLLVHRTISKNLSTYLEGFLPLLDKNDRIHPSFLLHGTKTGRASSQNPNAQNITKHSKIEDDAAHEVVGMVMRNFIVPEGHAMVTLDLSQAELRIIADFANETTMINAYNNGQDLHALTASGILKKTLEEFYAMPDEERDYKRFQAKAVNFGAVFDQSPEGYQRYAEEQYGLKLTINEATTQIESFFEIYPKLREYHATQRAKARKFGYVRTLLGRTRRTPNILNEDEYLRAEDERISINSPIQGSCGELTIFGCAILNVRSPESCKFINSVHDSIMTLVPLPLVPYFAKLAKHTMENLPTEVFFNRKLKHLKLVADIEVSTTNWKELKKYKEDDWKEFSSTEIDSYYQFINENYPK